MRHNRVVLLTQRDFDILLVQAAVARRETDKLLKRYSLQLAQSKGRPLTVKQRQIVLSYLDPEQVQRIMQSQQRDVLVKRPPPKIQPDERADQARQAFKSKMFAL